MAISLFAPTAKDLSLEYLYTIFGPMNGVIDPYSVNIESGTVTLTLLGAMFKTFNSIILGVGAFVIVYVTVVGVMATAHEGQFMGKKWNNMWLPIRTVLGISALVPTASGYSGIQIIMMWFIVQGIGAADSVWNTALGFLNETGSPYAKVLVLIDHDKDKDGVTPVSFATVRTFQEVFKAVTCDNVSRLSYQSPGDATTGIWPFEKLVPGGAPYYCGISAKSSDPFCRAAPDYSTAKLQKKRTLEFGPGGSCGKLTFCNYKQVCASNGQASDCTMCRTQIEALSTALNQMNSIASILNRVDYDYRVYKKSADLAREAEEENKATKPPSVAKYCEGKDGCDGILPGGSKAPYKSSAESRAVSDVYWPYMAQVMFDVPNLEDVPKDTNLDFLKVLATQYEKMTLDGLSTELVSTSLLDRMENLNNLSGEYKKSAEQGWILAGGYYQFIARQSQKAVEFATPTLQFVIPPRLDDSNLLYKCALLERDSEDGGDEDIPCRDNVTAAGVLASEAAAGQRTPSTGAGVSSASTEENSSVLSDATQAASSTSMKMEMASGDQGIGAGDPVADLILEGTVLMKIAQSTYLTMLILLLVLGTVSSINVMAMGSGLSSNPVIGGLKLLYQMSIPVILAYIGLLLSIGATYAVYVPMIPFMIFTLGVVGWYTSVIEAMVAGPLVALGILSPSGQHELLGKAEAGVGILFNVFLRPTLMIFGFIAAVLLAGPMIDLLNKGFVIAMGSSEALNLPIGYIISKMVHASIAVTVLSKCFAAIHVIPEKVGRWIGMAGEQYGESTQDLKGAVDSGASQTKGMAESSAKAGGDAVERSNKAKADKAAADKEDKRSQSQSSVSGGSGGGGDAGGGGGKRMGSKGSRRGR